MRIIKKIFIGLLVFLAVWGIAGFFIVPPLVRPFIEKKISAALHRRTAIEKISINPYAVSVTVKGFSLEDPGRPKPFAAFGELYVKADLTSSIFRRALILKKITLTNPHAGIVRKPDGTYNFSDLTGRDEKKSKPAGEEKPFHFSLNNIQIINGSVDFEDAPNHTNHTVEQLSLSVPFVSNIEYYLTSYVEPKFSAVINKNRFELVGRTRPFLTSRSTSFDINVQDLDIPFYLNYVPLKMNSQLKSARLDTRMKINFIINRDKSPSLTLSGDAALTKVILDDLQDRPILQLPSLKVKLASVEPFASKIHLERIALESPLLVIRCDKNGEFNILNLTKKQAAAPESEKQKPASSGKKSGLIFMADHVLLDKADVTYIDSRKSQPVNIHVAPLNLKAAHVSTEKGETAKVEMDCLSDKNSVLKAAGTLSLAPLGMDLDFDFKNISIRAFQPYFTDYVKIDVNRGSISSAGKFSLSKNRKDGLVIQCTGDIGVLDLATVDKAQSNDFLKFKNLSLDKIRFGYNPFYLYINTIALADFYSRIIINPDASINVRDVFGKDEGKDVAAKPEEKKPAKENPAENEKPDARDIKIGRVIFKNGHIDFSDKNIRPNYSANILNLNGSVTGLSSKEFSRADVMLKGNLGYGSPIDISGKINPLVKDLFADIKVGFRDIELSPVTPYSGKYLGYPITRGKLSFNVSYLIDKRKLNSENKIMIDQLTLGDKVESPDAVKAPVTLAVSLLTDRNGRINLDIPVSGSLDDPKFKIWSVVWQIIVNLITRAATSPFTLIASLTGGGEELSFAEFDYGSATVTDESRKKISMIGKALHDRPNIKLDIEGYVDVQQDRAELIRGEFDRRIRAQKLKDVLAKGEQDVTLEQIRVSGEEYEKYLKQAYQSAKFSKPRNIFGFEKNIEPAEMKKLMLANIEITESDLRGLAALRARNVKELLLQSDSIGADRIFIVEPSSITPEKKDGVKDSRINFRLK